MINIFGLPKVARTYRGLEYDLWVTVCHDIRHWKEIPIDEVKKPASLAHLCKMLSCALKTSPPAELVDVENYLNPRRQRRPSTPRKSKKVSQ